MYKQIKTEKPVATEPDKEELHLVLTGCGIVGLPKETYSAIQNVLSARSCRHLWDDIKVVYLTDDGRLYEEEDDCDF